ncbi:hypothetical protein KE531_18555 [Eubacteriaceae bacterium Marseille-Q4139]|nr:hypothetical protein [Eubacteriaceae bacterium Marseille-Q4139]
MSKTYRSRSLGPVSSNSAMPLAPRLTQRFILLFHSSNSAQAVAPGRWAWIRRFSWNEYRYSLAAVSRYPIQSRGDRLTSWAWDSANA